MLNKDLKSFQLVITVMITLRDFKTQTICVVYGIGAKHATFMATCSEVCNLLHGKDIKSNLTR